MVNNKLKKLKEIAVFLTDIKDSPEILGLNEKSIHLKEEYFHDVFENYNENERYDDYKKHYVTLGTIEVMCLIHKIKTTEINENPVIIEI